MSNFSFSPPPSLKFRSRGIDELACVHTVDKDSVRNGGVLDLSRKRRNIGRRINGITGFIGNYDLNLEV